MAATVAICDTLGDQAVSSKSKPRVLLLVDVPRWAFDFVAHQMVRILGDEFRLDIRYVRKRPRINAKKYDLLYVFFWGEDRYKRWDFPPDRIIKEVSSHRWRDDPTYGPCTPKQMAKKFLRDAHLVACTSQSMQEILEDHHPRVRLTSNGIDPGQFYPLARRTGPLTIGWSGNANVELKGLQSILEPACEGRFNLKVAPGNLSYEQMNEFYNSVDVFAIASRHEGQPITLVEAMATGCFPVCNRVGIVPELVQDQENGLIVSERTPEAYREAFQWCHDHLDEVRSRGAENAKLAHQIRNWEALAPNFRQAFHETLQAAKAPKFRNDDISWDTDLECLKQFCDVFHQHNYTQIHGAVLFGETNCTQQHDGVPCEYEGVTSIADIPNAEIRRLSADHALAERKDIIDYLNSIPDEVALHGLYHTDYSTMSVEEQRSDITEGLAILDELFPKKMIRYFIAPFNRVGPETANVCREFNLQMLAGTGVHLEAELPSFVVEENQMYRYHHHRFYPQSSFDYYQLDMQLLDEALSRVGEPNIKHSGVFKKIRNYFRAA